jgi:hypothetical protein
MVMEGKELYGYDRKVDKYIASELIKGEDMVINAYWYTSKNNYTGILSSDISNPENASFKVQGEFKSPDMILETITINGKHIRTNTWTRVK